MVIEIIGGLGRVVHDVKGNAWVYIGYRVTTCNTYDHHFCKEVRNTYLPQRPWMYNATNPDTLCKKFPDLTFDIIDHFSEEEDK